MRLKNIPGSREAIAKSEYVFLEDDEQEAADGSFSVKGKNPLKGHWSEIFGNSRGICLEIGMGKGQFIMEMARRNPDVNFVGIEKYSSVLLRAMQKQEEERLANVRFIRMDAELVEDVFEQDEIEKIYLNFSDPWPKEKTAKRRLTSRRFLARYDKILKADGVIEFKTDNVPLFDFSLEEAPEAGWKVLAFTRDLHGDPVMNEGNVMTEYEERFSGLGNKICKMIICR